MRFLNRHFRRILIVALIAFSITSVYAHPREVDESSVSAALTLRMAKFITWPHRPELKEDRPFFIIGVMGNANSKKAFAALNGKNFDEKSVKIVGITKATHFEDLRRCHIVFVDDKNDVKILDDMIGESPGILSVTATGIRNPNNHVCISLVKTSGKIAFDVNLKSTRRAELDVNASLLRLARKVQK